MRAWCPICHQDKLGHKSLGTVQLFLEVAEAEVWGLESDAQQGRSIILPWLRETLFVALMHSHFVGCNLRFLSSSEDL